MPYAHHPDLPVRVRAHLPPQAQDIYRAAFNSAWNSYGAHGAVDLEALAARVAWAAVKRRYCKIDGEWVRRADCDGQRPSVGAPTLYRPRLSA